MKFKNMNGEAILVPVAEGEAIVAGAIYEVTAGKAKKAGFSK